MTSSSSLSTFQGKSRSDTSKRSATHNKQVMKAPEKKTKKFKKAQKTLSFRRKDKAEKVKVERWLTLPISRSDAGKSFIEAAWKRPILAREFGTCEMQGKRPHMEDRHLVTQLAIDTQSTSSPSGVCAGKKSDSAFHDSKPLAEPKKRTHCVSAPLTTPSKSAIFPIPKRSGGLPLCAVFDGHGGSCTSAFVSKKLPKVLAGQLAKVDLNDNKQIEVALRCAFLQTDALLREVKGRQTAFDGSTAVLALGVGDTLYIANAGDSRAVLCRRGKSFAITLDHKPTNTFEEKRIMAAGGKIKMDNWHGLRTGTARIYAQSTSRALSVSGGLAVSRSFGDFHFKNEQLSPEDTIVSVVPDVSQVKLYSKSDYVILASDGLFDVMTNGQVAEAVHRLNKRGCSAQKVAEQLIEQAVELGSLDNVTVVVISA